MQTINIALRILSRPEEAHLPWILDQVGNDYDERILPSIGNEVLKAVVAQYNADQLLTMRESVSRQINDELSQRAKQFHLLLDDVAITHLTFGQEYTQAIEFKQVAQQEAERSKFVVMKAEQEKRTKVIEAEGESEAAHLISDALSKYGSGLIEVRRIDGAREIAETLSGSRNVAYLPGSGMLFNLGMGQAAARDE
jgi:prohibitin 1